jgi:hypothetical protein
MAEFKRPHCILCGSNAGSVRVDLDDGRTMTCTECEDEFTVDDVLEVIGTWQVLLSWLETHPARQPK